MLLLLLPPFGVVLEAVGVRVELWRKLLLVLGHWSDRAVLVMGTGKNAKVILKDNNIEK